MEWFVVSTIESIPVSNPVYSRAEPFCTILSAFSAVSDSAPMLFIRFSWPVFSEIGGQILLPSLS